MTFVARDLLEWMPPPCVDVWHERAVLHFLTETGDRARHAELASRSVVTGGRLVIGAFSSAGPTQCSGLPTARRSAPQLATEFGTGVELEYHELEGHLTPSGTRQAFTLVVLRGLA